jgi:hypothetical protein
MYVSEKEIARKRERGARMRERTSKGEVERKRERER